ncbi:unnamed protein product [Pichia kudriavzevii]
MSRAKRSALNGEISGELSDLDISRSERNSLKRQRIESSSNSVKEDAARRIAIATGRVMLGLSSRNQALNKTIISKIIETENERGTGLQFKKNVLPILSNMMFDTFRYAVEELPSKKVLMSSISVKEKTKGETKAGPLSDGFILTNNISASLRALNYTFMAKNTRNIGKSIKGMQTPKENMSKLKVYGEGLPKPTSMIVQNGFKLLIICVIILHNNNILQSDLTNVLKTKFGLSFKEKEQVSILGNQTLSEFIAMLSKQDYIERMLISNTYGSGGISQRSLNSKNAKHDDNSLVLKLGRRCLAEWTMEEFVGIFRQLMQSQWTDQLQEAAIFTVSNIWKS